MPDSSYLNVKLSHQQEVKLNAPFSTPFTSASGAFSHSPQGIVRGALIFLIFINDIIYALPNCHTLLHADDPKMFTPVSDTNDCWRLKNCLYSFTSWCKLYRLGVNINKFAVITFSRKRFPILYYTEEYYTVLNFGDQECERS